MTDFQAPQPAPNGGPAFPMPSYLAEVGASALEAAGASQQIAEQFAETACGMSLRDYFAAKAMQGFAACPDVSWAHKAEMAAIAYKWADAMLEARNA